MIELIAATPYGVRSCAILSISEPNVCIFNMSLGVRLHPAVYAPKIVPVDDPTIRPVRAYFRRVMIDLWRVCVWCLYAAEKITFCTENA